MKAQTYLLLPALLIGMAGCFKDKPHHSSKQEASTQNLNASTSSVRLVNSMPEGFKISHADAIAKARPFFVENPFALRVFADNRYYFVDIASSKIASAERAKKRGVWIDGRTGEIVQDERRIIGK
jgi:hypothetical protein